MASCIKSIYTKNYQNLNLIIDFQVAVGNVGDVLLGHSVVVYCCRHCFSL